MIGWHLRIVDRHPFWQNPSHRKEDHPDVRDVYLCTTDKQRNNDAVMWRVDMPLKDVQELYTWAVAIGIRVEYDYGTTDDRLKRPSGLPGV